MLKAVKQRGTVEVSLEGELDHHSAAGVRQELDTLIADPKVKRLVLDLSGLMFMDSSGIGVVIGRYKEMSRRGGSVAVRAAKGHVDRIFEMAGLYQIIERLR